jgi:hypothetical protein
MRPYPYVALRGRSLGAKNFLAPPIATMCMSRVENGGIGVSLLVPVSSPKKIVSPLVLPIL